MQVPSLKPDELRTVRRLAAAERHPRLLVDAAERDAILERAESGLCRELADHLKAKCRAYLDPDGEHFLDLDSYDSDALLARPGQYVLGRIMSELSFAGWLWQEEEFLAPARSILLRRAREALLTTPGDNPDSSHFRSPLGIGSTGSALAWSADLLRPFLSDAEWAEVVSHVRSYYLDYARLDFFESHRLMSVGFNKTLLGMCAIGQLTLLVAEDLTDEELGWGLSQSLRSAWGYSREAMDDDGGCYEGPGYGSICVGGVIRLAESLRAHGLPQLSQYDPLRRHGQWIASILAPGGGTLPLGDSNAADNVGTTILLLARWHCDPGLQWTYRRGLGRPDHPNGPYGDNFDLWNSVLPQQLAWHDPELSPAEPDSVGWPTAFHARGSDYVTLRSGWSEQDATAVLVGAGRRASAAAHRCGDVGAIDFWAFGQELLHDPGYGFATVDAHSAVQVSGVGTAFMPGGGNATFGARVERFAEGEFASLAAVEMAQMLDCRWAFRDVVLVRGQNPYLIVADDINYRSDWSDYEWFWQAPPDGQCSAPSAGQPARITTNGVTLDIFSIAPPPDAYPRACECAWTAEEYAPESWCAKEATLNRLRMRLTGYNGCLLTVLVPRAQDTQPVSVAEIECLRPGIAATVSWDDSIDTIVFQPMSRLLQTEALVGTGRLAVVREQDEEVRGCVLDEGYELEWRGQQLVPPRSRAGEVIVP